MNSIVARNLRKSMTDAESIIWERLRNRKLSGRKFRRQQPIEGFIADFFCNEVRLVVEIDGDVHDSKEQKEIDEHRDRVFLARGLKILRIRNEEVEMDLEKVLSKIEEACRKL